MSCTGQKKGEIVVDNNKVGIQVEEIIFPPQNILQLKSYYLSSFVHQDSINALVGYNYRLHSLDYINLKTKRVTQTQLSDEGPNAITRLSGIYANTLDSVWVTDESEYAYLLDSTGVIKKTVNFKKYMDKSEQLFINTNYAMHTSHLYYNNARQSLMFLVKNLLSNTFGVKEVFIDDSEKKSITYKLLPSKIVTELNKDYVYMNAPNVNFVGENIIYNYPVESSVYTLNILTNERNYYLGKSCYTSNVVKKCTSPENYSALEKHRIENPHFYDVMYIPKFKIYARLHVDKVEFDAKKSFDNLINDRDLYLMLFNDNFSKICEVKLLKRRYNYFTGWSASYGGIILFVDNALDEHNSTDDLIMDLIFPERLF